MPTGSIDPQNQPTDPILSPKEWARVVQMQQIDKQLPEHKGSGWVGIELRPKNFRFATQNKGEKVFILLRRHWFTNLSWMMYTVLYVLIPLILSFVLGWLQINLSDILGWKLVLVILLLYYSVVITSALRHFVNWYFNLYLVTNERIIDYDFQALTSRGASEIELNDIEDVSESSIGFLPSMFNYGDVVVYSAAEKEGLRFDHVPQPVFVRDKISDLAKIAERAHDEP